MASRNAILVFPKRHHTLVQISTRASFGMSGIGSGIPTTRYARTSWSAYLMQRARACLASRHCASSAIAARCFGSLSRPGAAHASRAYACAVRPLPPAIYLRAA